MNKKYAIFVKERDDLKELMVWYSEKRHIGRKFFYGGSGIMACIFTTWQSAHAFAKKEKLLDDFSDGAQMYVRPINISIGKEEK